MNRLKISLVIPTIIYFSIASTLSSCSKTEDYKRSRINSDLLISLKTNDFATRIQVETSEIYNCANYEIEQQTEFSDDEVIITFKKVKEFDLCATAIGSASTSIEIDPKEISKFKMKLRGKWYTGSIHNDELNLDNPEAIKLKEE